MFEEISQHRAVVAQQLVNTFEKARYVNNSMNRKLNRVGKEYGSSQIEVLRNTIKVAQDELKKLDFQETRLHAQKANSSNPDYSRLCREFAKINKRRVVLNNRINECNGKIVKLTMNTSQDDLDSVPSPKTDSYPSATKKLGRHASYNDCGGVWSGSKEGLDRHIDENGINVSDD